MSIPLEAFLAQPDVRQESANSWFVTCPSHKGGQETTPSLHVTRDSDGSVRFHCFGGCTFGQVVQAFQGFAPVQPKIHSNGHANGHSAGSGPLAVTKVLAPTPLEWLAAYTSLSQAFLATQDIDFDYKGKIGYVFPHSRAIKWRDISEKGGPKGNWDTNEDSPPPVWPELPEELPEVVFLTAGETDCLCLRATGAEAFALTKGEMGLPPAHLFKEMTKRGAQEVVYTADVDEVGKQAAGKLLRLIDDAGLEGRLLDLTEHLNAALGEKDVRALTRRVGVQSLRVILETEYLRPPELPNNMAEFVAQAPPEIPWVMTPLIVRGATTLISGHAKAGKTTFIIKTMLTMHDGGQVLNMPVHQGRVLIWTENSALVWKAKLHGRTPEQVDHIYVLPRSDPRFLGKTFEENIRIVFDIAVQLECVLIVLDTLTGLAAIEEENEAGQVSAALVPVSKLAQRTQIACVMVHHMSKAGTERGSTVFLSEPDILVRLEGEYAEERTLRVKSNMLINPPEDVVFKMNAEGEYEQGVGGVSNEEALAILDVLPLTQKEAISLQEIAMAMRLDWSKSNRDSLANQVEHLVKAGRVRRISQGVGMPAMHFRIVKVVAHARRGA